MRYKLYILLISLLIAVVFMSGGYSYWQKNITIDTQKVNIIVPALEGRTQEDDGTHDTIAPTLGEEENELVNHGFEDKDIVKENNLEDSEAIQLNISNKDITEEIIGLQSNLTNAIDRVEEEEVSSIKENE